MKTYRIALKYWDGFSEEYKTKNVSVLASSKIEAEEIALQENIDCELT